MSFCGAHCRVSANEKKSGAAQASVMVAEGRDASIAVGQHWEETWAAVVEFALGPSFCHHFRSSFLFAAVEGEDATCPRLEPNRSIMGG